MEAGSWIGRRLELFQGLLDIRQVPDEVIEDYMIKSFRDFGPEYVAMPEFKSLIGMGLARPANHAGAQIDADSAARIEGFQEISRTAPPFQNFLSFRNMLSMKVRHLGVEARLNPSRGFIVLGHPIEVTL